MLDDADNKKIGISSDVIGITQIFMDRHWMAYVCRFGTKTVALLTLERAEMYRCPATQFFSNPQTAATVAQNLVKFICQHSIGSGCIV